MEAMDANEEWDDCWAEDDLEEDLSPIYMTRNEILFLDDSLTMMIEKDGMQEAVTTMRPQLPTAYLPAPVSLIDKLGMAVLRITDPDEINTGTVSGNTITVELYDEAECNDDDGNNTIDAADEAACEAAGGAWEDAECIEVVFTSSGS